MKYDDLPVPRPSLLAEPEMVGAYEAKTHLSKLLEQVELGKRFVITRHGKPVARLEPVGGRMPIGLIVAAFEELAVKGDLGDEFDVRELAHEGHDY